MRVQQLFRSLRAQRQSTPLAQQVRAVTVRLVGLAVLFAAQAVALQALWFAVAAERGEATLSVSALPSWLGSFLLPHIVSTFWLPLLPLALPAFTAVAEAGAAARART